MKKTLQVLSLFDGHSGGQIALKEMGLDCIYYASEIDKYAIQAAMLVFPDTRQLGCVKLLRKAMTWSNETFEKMLNSSYLSEDTKQKFEKIRNIDWAKTSIIFGGFPCQSFSVAGNNAGFEDHRGQLFFDAVKILNHIKKLNPQVKFVFENVRMKHTFMNVITKNIGVKPVQINSARVSAQNRIRFYWTNVNTCNYTLFGDIQAAIPQPKEKKIRIKDILEPVVPEKYYLSEQKKNRLSVKKLNIKEVEEKASTLLVGGNGAGNNSMTTIVNMDGYSSKEKSPTIVASYGKGIQDFGGRPMVLQVNTSLESNNRQPYQTNRVYNVDGISPALCSTLGRGNCVTTSSLRRLTPRECGRLQTVPEWVLDILINANISDTQLYRMFGNGWTIEVIKHILSYGGF